jgi:hypothetical protein
MNLVSKFFPVLCLLTALLTLSAFTSQPMNERQAQDTLPMSKHPMWQMLGKTKIHIDEKKGFYSATVPADVKALSGKEITINGFMLPLESTDKFKHFLISKRTPTCPFCPPGEPNEIMDVWMDKPVAYSEDLVTVKGKFQLMNDREMGLFFKLKDAKLM